ncbi:MAG: bacteriohemerythrin [Synergistales bacterium]|nr:bacteriohemerythrin [Synergistales bacterium]
MSTVFNWNDSFLTGIEEVDRQHKQLVDLVNDLGELAMSGEAPDEQEFSAAIDAMVDYTHVHFRDEEELMASSGLDPRHIRAHHEQHQAFIDEATVFSTKRETLATSEAKELLQYLVDWLAYHILGIDQSMARQMRAIEKGKTAAQTFEEESRNTQEGAEPLLTALKGLFQTVSERNRELRALNRTLEQKVKERTAELERANQQLQALAIRDELTGLPNRRFAVSALEELWSESRDNGTPLSVLMLDADKFKQVNDTFGHDEGDSLLRELSRRLLDAAGSHNMVCRLGGDEFLVICPHAGSDEAAGVGRAILASRRSHYTDAGEECWDGAVSLGYAAAGPSMDTPGDLLKAADRALYEAKRRGGDQMAPA